MAQSQYSSNIQFKGKKRLILGRIRPIKKTIIKIIEDHKKRFEYIYLNFISNKQILKINKDYLKHDYYTDVITFNYSENQNMIEGDSYISIDYINEYSKNNKISPKEEILRIIFHSILHMVGHNDIEASQKKTMTKLENKYLRIFNKFHVEQTTKKVPCGTNNK